MGCPPCLAPPQSPALLLATATLPLRFDYLWYGDKRLLRQQLTSAQIHQLSISIRG